MFKLKRNIVILLLQIVFLTLYAVVGGFLFCLLEGQPAKRRNSEIESEIIACLKEHRYQLETERMFDICIDDHLAKQHWDMRSGVLFAFASITTIGYGSLVLTTTKSRVFYIGYCLVGMPSGLLVLANLGKFTEEAIGHLVKKFKNRKKIQINFKKRTVKISPAVKTKRKEEANEDSENEPFELTGFWFLMLFVVYITFGIFGLMILKGVNFIHSIYANFLSITAVDASELLSADNFLPITMAYVTGGLALASIAIGILGRYLRKLHFIGQKLKDTGKAIIHFGGKDVSVSDLVKAVGEKWGVDQANIETIDLDNVVKTTIEGETPDIEVPPPDPDVSTIFNRNKRLAIRRHSNSSAQPGHAQVQMDPEKLHRAYEIEWNKKAPRIVQELGRKTSKVETETENELEFDRKVSRQESRKISVMSRKTTRNETADPDSIWRKLSRKEPETSSNVSNKEEQEDSRKSSRSETVPDASRKVSKTEKTTHA